MTPAQAAALSQTVYTIAERLKFLADYERGIPFARLMADAERQSRFIHSIAPTFYNLSEQVTRLHEGIRRLTESPVMRYAEDLVRNAQADKDYSARWVEFILRQSQVHQQHLEVLHSLELSSCFEPLVRVDRDGTSNVPLYVIDFPDPPNLPAPEKPIIAVSNFLEPELVKFFHKHPEQLKTIDRRKFEEFVAELMQGLGFTVELTAQTRDGGKDIIAISRRTVHVKYLIECKRPNPGNPVGVAPVRALLGVKDLEKATKAILATTSYFSPDALEIFKQREWELEARDFDGLQEWIRAYLSLH